MYRADCEMSCCICSSHFFIRGGPRGNRCLPHFLKCGHSACERCINRLIMNLKGAACNVCNVRTVVSTEEKTRLKTNNDLFSYFPPNLHFIGTLYFNTFVGDLNTTGSIKHPSIPAELVPTSVLKRGTCTLKVSCGECKSEATMSCLQCDLKLCNGCFDKIHSFVSLKNHTKVPLEINDESNSSETCDRHTNSLYQFYCITCSEYLCSECIISSEMQCKNHNVTSISQKNLELYDKLQSYKPRLSCILNNIMKSKYNANLESKTLMNDGTQSEYDIVKNKIMQDYSKAYAAIQFEEFSKIKVLQEHKNNLNSDFQAKIEKLTAYKNNIEKLLEKLNLTKNALVKSGIKMVSLCKEVEEAFNTPCIFTRGNYHDSISYQIDQSFFGAVKQYCTIVVKPLTECQLSPSPPTVEIEKVEIDNDSLSTVTEDEKSIDLTNDGIPEIPYLSEGSIEKIIIVHIENPGEFYVRRSVHLPLLSEMTESFRNDPPTFCDPSDIVAGRHYLSYDENVREWYRVFINDSLGCADNKDKTESYIVKYIDFGHKANILASTIAMIPGKYNAFPPLLLRCSLPCNPIGCSWTKADSEFMQRILFGYKYCHILIRKVRDSSVEAEVYTIPLSPFDSQISITEAMTFLGHAKYSAGNKVNMFENPLKVKMHYFKKLPADILKNNDEIIITDIPTPNFFFARKVELEGQMNEIQICLNDKLSINKCEDMVYNPKSEMCVACYSEILGWCRAIIQHMENFNIINVFLVDYGKCIKVAWSMLRKLEEKGFDYPEMVIRCKLDGIMPVLNRHKSQAFELLEKCAKSWVPPTVQVVKNNRGIFEIKLNASIDGVIMNINNEFVKRGYATVVSKPEKVVTSVEKTSDTIRSKVFKNQEITLEKTSVTIKREAPKKKKIAHNKKTEEPKSKKLHSTEKETPPDCKTSIDREKDSKLYVKILSAINPSNIYVTFLSQEKEMADLKKKLNSYYANNQSSSEITWNEGDKCAAFYPPHKSWYRGIIKAVKEDKLANVFLKDIAKSVEVSIMDLQPLAEKFLTFRDGAIKCHMADIIPAIGKNWPNITCEYIQDIATSRNQFFITKDGKIDNKSMPIKLWMLYAEETDALEPIVEKWKMVNEMIVYRGLAIREKEDIDLISEESKLNSPKQIKTESKTHNENPSQTDDDMKNENSLEIQNQTESLPKKMIKQWLPANLPTKRNFCGIPTFVDEDFNIYIHVPDFHERVMTIDRTLDENYKDSSPGADDMFWFEGQPCIAQWSHDSNFYRGIVKKINSDGMISVQFVDYGNVQNCHVSTLRKHVMMEDIPMQIFICKLHGVIPKKGDIWDPKILDYVHLNIVEKSCSIMVLGQDKDGAIYVNVKRMEDGIDVIDLLMKKNFASMGGFPMLNTIPGLEEPTEDDCKGNIEDDDDIIIDDEYQDSKR